MLLIKVIRGGEVLLLGVGGGGQCICKIVKPYEADLGQAQVWLELGLTEKHQD